MKKTITFLILSTLFCHISKGYSQEAPEFTQHEVAISISDGLPIQIVYAFSDIFSSVINSLTDRVTMEDRRNSTPVFSGSYSYYPSKRVAWGLNLSYFRTTKFQSYSSKNTNALTYSQFTSNLFGIAPQFKMVYLDKNRLELYGRLMVGVYFENSNRLVYSDDPSIRRETGEVHMVPWFNGQLNPIGYRYGGNFGGFVELGLGTNGFIALGLSYRP